MSNDPRGPRKRKFSLVPGQEANIFDSPEKRDTLSPTALAPEMYIPPPMVRGDSKEEQDDVLDPEEDKEIIEAFKVSTPKMRVSEEDEEGNELRK